jgi:hypothetical protein
MSINKNSSVNHRTSGARGRILAGIAVAAGTIASATSAAAAEPLDSPDSFTERLVHRYLQVAIAPNGADVASVEGD